MAEAVAAAAVGAGGDVDGAANPVAGNQVPLRPDLAPAIPVSQPLKDLQQAQGEMIELSFHVVSVHKTLNLTFGNCNAYYSTVYR